MQRQTFRLIWVICVLVAASLACSLVTGIGERVGGAKQTAQGVATDIQAGREILSTGRAVATQVLGSGLAKTAQAFVTEQGPGLMATAQTFATEQGPSLMATAQAFATEQGPSIAGTAEALITQQGPGLQQTLEAFTTEQGPGLVATAEAMATSISGGSGEQLPEDLPFVSGERQNLISNSGFISYETSQDFKSVLDFYQKQMPLKGWTANGQAIITSDAAVLNYEKANRKVTITITKSPGSSNTLINILTLPQ